MSKFIVVAALLATAASVAQAQVQTPATPPAASQPQRSASAWLALGLNQQEDGNNLAAKASLDEALKLQPDFAVARLTRATVLSELKQTDAAISDVDALGAFAPPDQILRLKIDIFLKGDRARDAVVAATALTVLKPASADAHRRLAQSQKAVGGKAAISTALAEYEKALKLDPDMLVIYRERGEILVDRGDVRGVERNFEAWLAKAPEDAEAHLAYASALDDLDKADKARVEVDRALELKPSVFGYVLRARLAAEGQQQAALADLDRAVALDPKSTYIYYARAALRLKWKQPEPALVDADKLQEISPDSDGPSQIRYQAQMDAGRYDLAVKAMDVLVARHPDDAMMFNNRCWARALGNLELDRALADCETSIKLSRSAANLDSRAFVKLRQGDLSGAIADYDAALKLEPDQEASLFGRGVAKRRAGQTAAGDADLAKARKLSPDVDKRFAGYGVTP